MKHSTLTVSANKNHLSINDYTFPDFISPSIRKGTMSQTHYFFSASDKTAVSLQLDLQGAEKHCNALFAEALQKYSLPGDKFPYEQTENQWWQYCLAPHSYLALDRNRVQVGLNVFNRFLQIDLNSQSAQFVDPGVDHEILSTTNWFDKHTHELWFASWPADDTVRRIIDPQGKANVSIWKQSFSNGDLQRVWQGNFGDALHQISLSPDRRFLVLTELGLYSRETVCAVAKGQNVTSGEKTTGRELLPSEILILNLETGDEWRLPVMTAGHVEFDPSEPDICYVSCHNIGLIGVKVGIFGSGIIKKLRLGKDGPMIEGEFTHPDFHRITTHIVFRYRGKTLIGVSGYPDKVFLVDASTMKLFKIMELEKGEKVGIVNAPHLCQQDSYGIAASEDGEIILAAGTGFMRAGMIENGKFSFRKEMEDYGTGSCFTGHLGSLHSLKV